MTKLLFVLAFIVGIIFASTVKGDQIRSNVFARFIIRAQTNDSGWFTTWMIKDSVTGECYFYVQRGEGGGVTIAGDRRECQ